MGPWRVGDKKELEEIFTEQLYEIADENPLSHPPLHPYIRIWLGCKRYGNAMTGAPCLPGPGSYLEQDAELMLAFELLDDLWHDIEQYREEARKNREKVAELAQHMLGQAPQ